MAKPTHGHVHLVAVEGQSVAILDGGVLWAAHDELGWFKVLFLTLLGFFRHFPPRDFHLHAVTTSAPAFGEWPARP